MKIHQYAVKFCVDLVRHECQVYANTQLISPIATLIASEPSATTTQRQPSRLSSVSMIFAVMGLSSASKHVTARSLRSGPLLISMEVTEDGGVLTSIWLVA